ncbi:MAG TPA: ABC transporter permease subunit [Clostridiales bacterium]|nr:ABC transporter permease subunit [Clostridiales bacterium]
MTIPIQNQAGVTPRPGRKSDFMKRLRLHRQMYLFLLLPLIYLAVFKYWPMLGVQIAFRRFNPTKGIWRSEWVGFANFVKFFNSYQFYRVLANTLRISLYSLIAGFPIPILFALALNSLRSERYKKFIQNVTYMPHFISTVVIVGMLIQLFNTRTGIFGTLYTFLTGSDAPDLLANPDAFPHMYVWSGIWKGTGWGSIIYIAALSNVDIQQHEAALIDGASRFQRVLHIDLPAIIPTITIMLILRCGDIMSVGFEKTFLMQNNLNLRTSEVISTYVYKVGLSAGGGDFSYAAAIGLFNSVVNMILLTIVNWTSRRINNTSLW